MGVPGEFPPDAPHESSHQPRHKAHPHPEQNPALAGVGCIRFRYTAP